MDIELGLVLAACSLVWTFLYSMRLDLVTTRTKNAQERIDRLTTRVYELELFTDAQNAINARLAQRCRELEEGR